MRERERERERGKRKKIQSNETGQIGHAETLSDWNKWLT